MMEAVKNLIRNHQTMAGLIILVPLFLCALFSPFIATHDPVEPDLKNVLAPPSLSHISGTDMLGRDVFSRIVYGSRISLLVGFVSVGISVLIGMVIGAFSGYYMGLIDSITMRFVDLMMCFPTFFLILAVIALLEPSIWNIMIVIGLTNWMGIARLVRAEILSIKTKEYVLAAKAIGLPEHKIISGMSFQMPSPLFMWWPPLA
jgi:peptide/nickel transport system permease protein